VVYDDSMDLKEFIKSVLVDINAGVDEARVLTSREIMFTNSKDKRTVEFDIAVTVEETDAKSGKAGVRVLQLVEGGGEISKSAKNSTISRISFGLNIDSWTKEEQEKARYTPSTYEPGF